MPLSTIHCVIYTMTTDNNFMKNIAFEQIEVFNNKTILDYELASLYKSIKQHPLPRRRSDPVSTQIFIHNFQQKLTLPSISLSHRTKTDFSKQKRNQTQFKGKRFETLPSDIQCNSKFPNQLERRKITTSRGESSRKKQFIEIDMLSLMTWYAKNDLNKESNTKDQLKSKAKLETKDQIQEIAKIPTKPAIPTFIQNYKVVNELLNIDDLVRSPYFGVNFKEKQHLYFGQLKRGQMDGKGIMITLTWIFQGVWSSSKRMQGIQISPKGVYKGKFVNDERSKVGQFFWNNGQYYSGQWLKNKKHGTGVWKSSNGDVYMGQWVKGKVTGYGSHLTKKGQKYEGYFINFLKHGQGKQLFPNGDYFEGIFKQGRPHGFGIYKWKNGITYEGQFKEGFRDGNGIIKKIGIQYEGSFVKEKADGSGKLIVINGDNFSGNFKKGKKQGKGIHHQNKCIYIGTWHNNKFIQKQI